MPVSIKVVHQTAPLKHLLECSPVAFLYLFECTCQIALVPKHGKR